MTMNQIRLTALEVALNGGLSVSSIAGLVLSEVP